MIGYNVLVVGPRSFFFDLYDVRVAEVVYPETSFAHPASLQQTVGAFETREEAVRFMREVFDGLDLRLSR